MAITEWHARFVGTDLLFLSEQFHQWIPRREERIQFINHAMYRRTVRVDIDLSNYYDAVSVAYNLELLDGQLVVPVAILSRTQHTSIEVTDEAGNLLPRMTQDEERLLVYAGLLQAAEDALQEQGQKIEPATRDLIHQIVHQPPETDHKPNSQLTILRSHNLFGVMLQNAANSHLLLVALDPQKGRRRIISFSYLEPMSQAPSENGDKRLSGEFLFSTDVYSSGDCRSYHLELSAPPALRVLDARLTVDRKGGPAAGRLVATDDDRLVTHAHVHLSGVPQYSYGEFECRLALFDTGLVRTALASSVFSLVTIAAVAALVWLEGPIGLGKGLDTDAGTALFLLVPALAGPLFASSSNHGLTTWLQLPTRLWMLISGGASFVAAGTVATRVDSPLKAIGWSAAGAFSFLAALIIWKQWKRLRSMKTMRAG